MTTAREGEPRPLAAWLILGVLTFLLVFVWWTLRPGYSRDVRLGAFGNLVFALMLAFGRRA